MGQSSDEVNPSDVWYSEEAWSSHHRGYEMRDKKSFWLSRDLPGSYSLIQPVWWQCLCWWCKADQDLWVSMEVLVTLQI